MTHKRNTEGLRNNAKKKSQEAFQRAEQTISSLLKHRKTINFKTVAETSSVSIPYLYKTKSLRQRIEHLRKEQILSFPVKPPRLPKSSSENSKDSIIETLRLRIKELQRENLELKKQIEVAYGRIVLLESTPLK